MKYWVERWTHLRKKELMSYPKEFPINEAYTKICSPEELKSGFQGLHEIFAQCYEDVMNDPVGMMLPAYEMEKSDIIQKKQTATGIRMPVFG